MNIRVQGIVWLHVLALSAGVAHAGELQSLESIREAARAFLSERLDKTSGDGDVEIRIGRLDARLRLPRCEASLATFLPPGGRLMGNTAIGVRCPAGPSWSLYVPASVRRYAQVLVTARPLPRGQRVEADDLRLARRDISRIYSGYAERREEAVGQIVARPLQAGAVVTPRALEKPKLVRRGQRVLILARDGAVEVRMHGTALAAGSAGDPVRVRNLMSKQIVEGTITSDGTVEVGL